MSNKQTKKISLSLLIFCLLAAILVSVMATFAITTSQYQSNLYEIQKAYQEQLAGFSDPSGSGQNEFSAILGLLKTYGLYEIDEKPDFHWLLQWYIGKTGDKYADYYDADEYAALTSENTGHLVGIGVHVIENADEKVIEIINVMPDSPALESGLQPGDLITYIGTGADRKSVAEVGYEAAVNMVRGEEGTEASLTIKRGNEEKEFTIPRREVVSLSVTYHVHETDKRVGVIKIMGFDLTTPKQFCNAVDELSSKGCEYFIFDVRYNPGGDLASITAVLSYMLNKDDIVIRTSGRDQEQMTTQRVGIVNYEANSPYSECNVSLKDIAKYRNKVIGKSAVLVNGSTASAAELFTAALKDYKISLIVGTKTYGKGTMQSIYDLSYFGYTGAVKMTTKMYYPPLSEGYNDIGIVPDIEIEIDEALANKNIYKITDSEDNQMAAALAALLK